MTSRYANLRPRSPKALTRPSIAINGELKFQLISCQSQSHSSCRYVCLSLLWWLAPRWLEVWFARPLLARVLHQGVFLWNRRWFHCRRRHLLQMYFRHTWFLLPLLWLWILEELCEVRCLRQLLSQLSLGHPQSHRNRVQSANRSWAATPQ